MWDLGENFALLRPATQSSTHANYEASKAVDGNAVDDSSCAVTGAHDYNPWWKVQLAYPIWVTRVEITNRKLGHGMEQFCNYHKKGFSSCSKNKLWQPDYESRIVSSSEH